MESASIRLDECHDAQLGSLQDGLQLSSPPGLQTAETRLPTLHAFARTTDTLIGFRTSRETERQLEDSPLITDTLQHIRPRFAQRLILIHFVNPTVQLLALNVGQRQRIRLAAQTVPEFFNQL